MTDCGVDFYGENYISFISSVAEVNAKVGITLKTLWFGNGGAVASLNKPTNIETIKEASNTNLFQFPHSGNVVLELIQTPECGDSQLCVLDPHLQLSPLFRVVRVRAAMPAAEHIGWHQKYISCDSGFDC